MYRFPDTTAARWRADGPAVNSGAWDAFVGTKIYRDSVSFRCYVLMTEMLQSC